jgi:hypothetical protein
VLGPCSKGLHSYVTYVDNNVVIVVVHLQRYLTCEYCDAAMPAAHCVSINVSTVQCIAWTPASVQMSDAIWPARSYPETADNIIGVSFKIKVYNVIIFKIIYNFKLL